MLCIQQRVLKQRRRIGASRIPLGPSKRGSERENFSPLDLSFPWAWLCGATTKFRRTHFPTSTVSRTVKTLSMKNVVMNGEGCRVLKGGFGSHAISVEPREP